VKLESLEELRVFAQIVESGSLTAAGRALGMAPNTVSRRLAALEKRLGTVLLYRTTRSQSLTEAGRTLLYRAHRILGEAGAAEAALQQDGEQLKGLVRISVPSVLSHDLLRCLAPLVSANRDLELEVRVNDRMVNPVAEGFDLVIMGGRQTDSRLVARKVGEVTLVLVASGDYLARRGRPEHPRDLERHTLVRFTTSSPSTSWALRHRDGSQEVVPIRCMLETDDGRTLMDALALGFGIGGTSARVMRGMPALERVLPDHHLAEFPVHAVYPASGQRSARVLAVVEALREALAEPAP